MKKLATFLLSLLLPLSIAFSQYLDPLQTKWINIGSLQTKFQAAGAERAYNGMYYEGMKWPSQYPATDNHVIDRQWIVCRNFTDVNSVQYDYLGCNFSTSSVDPNSGYPMRLEQVAQFETPAVMVDNSEAGQPDYVDALDATMPYERKIINTFNSYLGVEFKRKIYAYSQQYHDNYFITEYVLTNTGNIDYDDDIELPSNTIEGLLFAIMPRYATSREAGYITDVQMVWGKHQWVSFMDMNDVNSYNPDSLRCFWTWLGQGDQHDEFDHLGAPDGAGGSFFNSDAGRLTSPQFAGMAVIHADVSATNKNNDPHQPLTMAWHGGDIYPSVSNKSESGSSDLYNMLTWSALYSDDNEGYGDTIPMVGTNPLRKPYGNEKPQSVPGNHMGGAAALMTFGPYDLTNIGDSIKIVIVEAVNGLNRDKCIEVGENWLADTNLILPDGNTASNRDQYKNEWFYTGRDSLFKTFNRAKEVYHNNFNIPNPPKPPVSFNVNVQDYSILINWGASPSETAPNFAGYRLYRALGSPDSIFHLLYECGEGTGNPLTHEFNDTTVIKTYSYYYYITSFTDGSNNTDPDLNPTGELESSRSYTLTMEGARVTGVAPEGTGSEEDPYLIDSKEDFDWMVLNPDKWDKHYRQISDISLAGMFDFIPIGNGALPFTGTYDGQGFTLDSLSIYDETKNYMGLFGNLSSATIENVHFFDVFLTAGNCVGALAGSIRDNTVISNCHASGIVTGNDYVGGLVGQCLSSTLYNSFSDGAVIGSDRTGGISGYAINSDIYDCYNLADISASTRVGGLIGHVATSDVSTSYSNGFVQGSSEVGGLVGFSYRSTSSSCFWDTLTSNISTSDLGSGRTTVDMKTETTFTDSGWNFIDTWVMDPSLNDGYPVLKWEVDGVATIPDIVQDFALDQNFPNPFNPITTIGFAVQYPQHVTLQIFDIRGHFITTLVDEFKEAGYWNVKWDASKMSSGLYIYRIQMGDVQFSRKMILMK